MKIFSDLPHVIFSHTMEVKFFHLCLQIRKKKKKRLNETFQRHNNSNIVSGRGGAVQFFK